MPAPPRPAASAAAADWLRGRVDFTGPSWVTATVGPGFAAYARILHPLGDEPDSPRWRDVAAANRRTLHPSARWEHISRPPGRPIPPFPTGRGYPGEPGTGDLRPVFLRPLCELLAAHTTTADRCSFAIWDGWGWWHQSSAILQATPAGTVRPEIEAPPDAWQLDPGAPRVDLPLGRSYLLYEGGVQDALRFGSWITATWFGEQSPSFFWPDDHAWCVATEVDVDSTLVGGSAALVEAIVAEPALEALAIDADAPFLA